MPLAQLVLMGAAMNRRREAEAGTGDPAEPHRRQAARKGRSLEDATAASHAALRAGK